MNQPLISPFDHYVSNSFFIRRLCPPRCCASHSCCSSWCQMKTYQEITTRRRVLWSQISLPSPHMNTSLCSSRIGAMCYWTRSTVLEFHTKYFFTKLLNRWKIDTLFYDLLSRSTHFFANGEQVKKTGTYFVLWSDINTFPLITLTLCPSHSGLRSFQIKLVGTWDYCLVILKNHVNPLVKPDISGLWTCRYRSYVWAQFLITKIASVCCVHYAVAGTAK